MTDRQIAVVPWICGHISGHRIGQDSIKRMTIGYPFADMFNTYRGHCDWPAVGQRRAGATTIKKYPGIISNNMLI